jgi:hypothetical protein
LEGDPGAFFMGIVYATTDRFDARAVRALLAAERIDHKAYARVCKLDRRYVSRILSGAVQPGELARIKLVHGLTMLGLESGVRNG